MSANAPAHDSSANATRRRWYDGHPSIAKGVNLLEAMPFDIQSIVAEGVNTVAENDCAADELTSSFKSLGKDKVLSMYKAKSRRRVYDQNPHFHKAMNYLYVLESRQRDFVAGKMLGITASVQSYVQDCQRFQQPINLRIVQKITLVCIEEGQDGVTTLLETLRAELKDHADNPQPADLHALHPGPEQHLS